VPLLAVSFLVFGSGMAPLHAHESDGPRSHALVHSHVEPHDQLGHHHDATRELDHGEHIVWLDMAVVHALMFRLDAPAAVLAPVPDLVVSARYWSAIVFDDAAPPHGPPRDNTSLRAPPVRPA
jgi:hypothetical protein